MKMQIFSNTVDEVQKEMNYFCKAGFYYIDCSSNLQAIKMSITHYISPHETVEVLLKVLSNLSPFYNLIQLAHSSTSLSFKI